jgi:hypothetical protein
MTDEALLEAFESATAPRESWTHEAHVRIAYLYLLRHAPPEALDRFRSKLRQLNASLGVFDGPESGYHETLTQAWLRVIAATIRSTGRASDSLEFCRSNPHLLARTLLRLYYTRQRILSSEAKVAFVEPDLAPLPRW